MGWRIDDDQIVRAISPRLGDPSKSVRLNQLVSPVEVVQRQVSLCPVEIPTGEIHAGRPGRPTGSGIDGERPGVAKEVEKPLALCLLSNSGAGEAMVQKQAAVEVVGKVYPKPQSSLSDGDLLAVATDPAVLLFAPFHRNVSLEKDPFRRDVQRGADASDKQLFRLRQAVVPNSPRRVIEQMDEALVPIDRAGELGHL